MKKKICVVTSCGGHLTEVRLLAPAYKEYPHFYVLNDKAILPDDMKNKTYFITHAERNWKVLINFWEAFQIFWKERPSLVISTGAGLIVPIAIVGKYLFRAKILYVESFASVEKPTLTGHLMYYLTDYFYYQWPELKSYFPKGECIEPLL